MQAETVMRLGQVLNHWRRIKDLGIREVAKSMSISHGTLSRIERGEDCDGQTLAKILIWLMTKS